MTKQMMKLAACLLALICVMPLSAMAADPSSSVCMSDIMAGSPSDTDGLVTQAVDYIKEVVNSASQDLYSGIIGNSGFKDAVGAAFALSIAVFGVAFMFGIVPFNFGQALVRMLKIGIILACVSTGGWTFFNDYAVKFFTSGVDHLINDIVEVATGDTSLGAGMLEGGEPQPFRSLENVAAKAISPEMMTSVIASFGTGAMGPAMGTLMGAGLIAFVMTLVTALRIYCISLVARAFLLGLGPIFITFMLFQKTQHIFDGWINQLVNYSLQPILLFAFISFYIVLLESAVNNILAVDTCWVSYDDSSGAPTTTMQWRFVDENGEATSSDFSWDGLVSCLTAGDMDCKDFPVSIIDILTFLILAHLAYRFSNVVTLIATEIASSTLNLKDLRSGLREYFQREETNAAAARTPRR
jgi:type IV secretory pathway VirB6-like protein